MKRHNSTNSFFRLANRLGLTAIALAATTTGVFGSAIDIHSTGAGLFAGQQDPNWLLTVNALNNGVTSFVAQGATVAELASTGAPVTGWPVNGPWPTDPNANWIAPQADVAGIAGVAADTLYVYTTTFDLSGLDPTTASLSGFWTADNYITQVQLNGVTVSSAATTSNSCASPNDPNTFYFQNLYPFSITGGFNGGVNTLSFSVTNSTCHNDIPKTNPTGLFVDIAGTAEPLIGPQSIPEPSTLLLAGIGLGLGVFARRRRQ